MPTPKMECFLFDFVGGGVGERGSVLDGAVTAARAGNKGEGIHQRGLAARPVADHGHVSNRVRAVDLHGRLLWSRDSRFCLPPNPLSNRYGLGGGGQGLGPQPPILSFPSPALSGPTRIYR